MLSSQTLGSRAAPWFLLQSQTVSNEPIWSSAFCAGWKSQFSHCIISKCMALTALCQIILAAAITRVQPTPGFESLKASPLPGLMEKLAFRLRSPEYPGSSLIMPRLVFHVDQFTSSTLQRQQQTQDLFQGSPRQLQDQFRPQTVTSQASDVTPKPD